ncbi:MAG: alpha/beta hydrolase [Tannerella sp.]|jgi:pimeloyl-ACP methyl ester carboxylesterase|nr:alpha/beta hydrolase [Tannerella sp.]
MKIKFIKYIVGVLIIMSGLIYFSCTSYSKIINESYQQLETYNVKTFGTEYGIMSYVDEGFGEAIIISHGIFGGYDQGYTNLYSIFGENYRKIAVSRFGYPGSDFPQEPTSNNQAKIFLELINKLQIDKVFLIAASAGGTAGIRFALDYPDRIKGLILLSSNVPSVPMTKKEIGRPGPPKFILNDRLMLFSIKNFKGVFYSMFGSKNVGDEVFDGLLPVKPRKRGIIADSEITNIDMDINFYDYPIENLKMPVLVIHAKDDPMVKYENIEYFLKRINAETLIFPDGGHLIIGHDITKGIINFMEKNRNE